MLSASSGTRTHRMLSWFRSRTNGNEQFVLSRKLTTSQGTNHGVDSFKGVVKGGPVMGPCQLGFRLYAGRGPTPADANPSTRGLIWIRAHTA